MQAMRAKNRRGVSLVEVLVVLVVLIIGIVALVRIFPEAFVTLNYGAEVTEASAWAKQNEDTMRDRQENMPDGIVGIDPATGQIRPNHDPYASVPYTDNPIQDYTGDPPEDPRYSQVNNARRVLGESLRVPPPTLNVNLGGPAGEVASLYHTNFSPIYSDRPLGPNAIGVQAMSGTPFRRVVIGQEPQSEQEWLDLYDLLDAFSYAIDYHNAKLYFRKVRYDRVFQIDYTHRTPTANNSYTLNQSPANNSIFVQGDPSFDPSDPSVSPPGQPSVVMVDLRVGQNVNNPPYVAVFQPLQLNDQLDPGSDQLRRKFVQRAVGDTFAGIGDATARNAFLWDFSEFKVYDTVYGMIGFHPELASTSTYTRQVGTSPVVRLDYDVDDWFILHEDVVVPTHLAQDGAEQFYTVKLSTNAIKQVGQPEDTVNFFGAGGGPVDTSLMYPGLIRSYPASVTAPQRIGTPGIDVVVVDLQSGLKLDSTTMQPPPGDSTNGIIDYREGVIRFRETLRFNQPGGQDAAAIQLPAGGRHLRVYYRTFNDLAVASYKPYGNYVRASIQKVYTLDPQTGLPILAPQEFAQFYYGYLLFSDADKDKTVLVDYTWQNRTTGELQTEVGELHRLEPPNTAFAPGQGANGEPPPGTWWVRLGKADPDPSKAQDNAADADVEPGSISIRGVRGASFHTHLVWRAGKRWRHVERSTIMTRSGAG